ncbi:hypothetical protein COBT_002071 [Conglomerata obtusa]
MLIFENADFFEYKIVFSLLTQKQIQLPNTETFANSFNASFLQLIQKLTYDTKITKNQKITFTPGTIIGGKVKHHADNTNITKFLIPILVLAPFTRNPFMITMTGITNDHNTSIDAFKHVYANILKSFGIENIECKIILRGFSPEGGGEVYFSAGNCSSLNAVHLKSKKIQKIKGLAISSKINASTNNLIMNYVKVALKDTVDIKMYSDVANGKEAGPSPGYQVVLYGEGVEDGFKSIFYGERIGDGRNIKDVAGEAVLDLLESIDKSGCYDFRCKKIIFSLVCVNLSDASQIELVEMCKEDFEFLEVLKMFFGFKYNLKDENDKIIFTAFGSGYKNYFKVLQ